jgi:hypothetical protein
MEGCGKISTRHLKEPFKRFKILEQLETVIAAIRSNTSPYMEAQSPKAQCGSEEVKEHLLLHHFIAKFVFGP